PRRGARPDPPRDAGRAASTAIPDSCGRRDRVTVHPTYLEELSMNNDRLPQSWMPVCALDDIVPNTGVCALVNGEQVAVFHVSSGDADAVVYAIENYDPGSQAAG